MPVTPPIPAGVRHLRDVPYVDGGGPRQQLDLYLAAQPGGAPQPARVPLVVWIHGGAWRMGNKAQHVPLWLLDEGYSVASINYRLSDQAVFPAQIEDCRAALRWLRAHATEHGLDPERIAAWGESAGGHLASMMGTVGDVGIFVAGGNPNVSNRVCAVIDFFGPTDFLQMDAHRLPNGEVHDAPDSPESRLIGGPIQERREQVALANPVSYVTNDAPPFLIVHGDADPLVPYHQSVLLANALEKVGVPVTFYTVRGGGHGGFTGPVVPQLVREFLAAQFASCSRSAPEPECRG